MHLRLTCEFLTGLQIFEGIRRENAEAGFESDCEAARILVEVGRQHTIVVVLCDEFLLLGVKSFTPNRNPILPA